MKRMILIQLLQKFLRNKKPKKTIFLFAGISLLLVLISGGFAIWGLGKGISRLAHQSHKISLRETITFLEEGALEKSLLKPGCLSTAENLLNPRVWLEEPIGEKFQELRMACIHPLDPMPRKADKFERQSNISEKHYKQES